MYEQPLHLPAAVLRYRRSSGPSSSASLHLCRLPDPLRCQHVGLGLLSLANKLGKQLYKDEKISQMCLKEFFSASSYLNDNMIPISSQNMVINCLDG